MIALYRSFFVMDGCILVLFNRFFRLENQKFETELIFIRFPTKRKVFYPNILTFLICHKKAMGNIPVGKFPISLSAAVAVDCGRRLLRRIHRLAKPYRNALLLFKVDASTTLCFFRHWFQTTVFFTRKNFQNESGLLALSLAGFRFGHAFALSVPAFEALLLSSP